MTDPAASDLPARARAVLRRLPPGAVDVASAALHRGAAAAGVERPDWVTPRAAAYQLVRPLVEVDDWPGPSEPLPVGGGAVHADLIDTDHELLARLRELLAGEGRLTPEVLAAEAQQWRLPVTPYRRLRQPDAPSGSPDAGPPPSGSPGDRPAPGDRPVPAVADNPGGPGLHRPGGRGEAGRGWPERPLVVDLTSLWAGPLATSLLAELGARVVKIDPACRPDGFQAHPGLYRSLNGAKEIIDLDLRRPADRAEFEALVARANLVVDSFSRRVMPNFGYSPEDLRRLNPTVATLSIVAFPAGSPEADWVSYGPGVHAASGLADPVLADPALADRALADPALADRALVEPDLGGSGLFGPDPASSGAADPAQSGPAGWGGAVARSESARGGGAAARFAPAPVAYPDALAGLAAFAAAAELLARRRTGSPAHHVEVSLAGALAPLVARARAGRSPGGNPADPAATNVRAASGSAVTAGLGAQLGTGGRHG